MAIDKSLYAAPQGLGALAAEPDLSIEIDNPDDVTIHAGDEEIDLMPEDDSEEGFDDNLAEYIDEGTLLSL